MTAVQCKALIMVVSRFDTVERAVEERELGVGFTEAALAENRGDHWPHNGPPAFPRQGARQALNRERRGHG